jgi:hypothetical protein
LGRDETRKFWHGKCSWCNSSFRGHRSFRLHRKGTCPAVKKRRAEERRADPGVPGPKPGTLEARSGACRRDRNHRSCPASRRSLISPRRPTTCPGCARRLPSSGLAWPLG